MPGTPRRPGTRTSSRRPASGASGRRRGRRLVGPARRAASEAPGSGLLTAGDHRPHGDRLAQVAGVVDQLAPGDRRSGPTVAHGRRRCRRQPAWPPRRPATSSATSRAGRRTRTTSGADPAGQARSVLRFLVGLGVALRAFSSTSVWSPITDGGGTGAGGGTFAPLRSRSFCGGSFAGRSRPMNASVGSVRQLPSATWSSTHACTSAPVTWPPSGTTAPITTRAGTPIRLASRAITAAYCSSLPAMIGALTKSSDSRLHVVAGVVGLLGLRHAVGVLPLLRSRAAAASTRAIGVGLPRRPLVGLGLQEPCGGPASPTGADGAASTSEGVVGQRRR